MPCQKSTNCTVTLAQVPSGAVSLLEKNKFAPKIRSSHNKEMSSTPTSDFQGRAVRFREMFFGGLGDSLHGKHGKISEMQLCHNDANVSEPPLLNKGTYLTSMQPFS